MFKISNKHLVMPERKEELYKKKTKTNNKKTPYSEEGMSKVHRNQLKVSNSQSWNYVSNK